MHRYDVFGMDGSDLSVYIMVLNLRLNPNTHRKAYAKTKLTGISLNGFIENAIETQLK